MRALLIGGVFLLALESAFSTIPTGCEQQYMVTHRDVSNQKVNCGGDVMGTRTTKGEHSDLEWCIQETCRHNQDNNVVALYTDGDEVICEASHCHHGLHLTQSDEQRTMLVALRTLHPKMKCPQLSCFTCKNAANETECLAKGSMQFCSHGSQSICFHYTVNNKRDRLQAVERGCTTTVDCDRRKYTDEGHCKHAPGYHNDFEGCTRCGFFSPHYDCVHHGLTGDKDINAAKTAESGDEHRYCQVAKDLNRKEVSCSKGSASEPIVKTGYSSKGCSRLAAVYKAHVFTFKHHVCGEKKGTCHIYKECEHPTLKDSCDEGKFIFFRASANGECCEKADKELYCATCTKSGNDQHPARCHEMAKCGPGEVCYRKNTYSGSVVVSTEQRCESYRSCEQRNLFNATKSGDVLERCSYGPAGKEHDCVSEKARKHYCKYKERAAKSSDLKSCGDPIVFDNCDGGSMEYVKERACALEFNVIIREENKLRIQKCGASRGIVYIYNNC